MNNNNKTVCRVIKMVIPTYPEPAKEKLPQYCENRCHQRTSGRVYPNAIVKEVVRDHKIDKEYTAIVLENDFIELIILPELGGRIFGARDKTNNYDFFYRQHVIKPALIGMLGSWISGGAEFNWPMHHRPSTFLPVDFSIENAEDGSVTVWLSEHEPMDRMKGMVGIKVSPDKAMFETRVRVFNRTELPQSFLWWENIGVPVNENYQIFFPQDVNHVHFHRKQSVAGYPMASGVMFNGKDYRHGERDIRRHKNTREATSYFSAPSNYDFFGGFDHGRKAGVVHVANHHISPGKKLFTWSYGQLAESWENALTDADGAYAELMAGVYSDNQPDFSWLEAGEVKQFSQFWYPIKELGEPLNANAQVAINFSLANERIEIYAVEDLKNVTIEISDQGKCVDTIKTDLAISKTTVIQSEKLKQCSDKTVKVRLLGADGKEIISFCRAELKPPVIPSPRPADPSPFSLDNPDELYLVGLHMKQYRDALTKPDVYWQRAVEINPMHYSSLIGLGFSGLKDFRLNDAERYFRKAITILTKYNPNPREGEAYYGLGLSLKWQDRFDEAYDAFYKAIWNYRWRSQGYYELATIDCLRQDFVTAKTHLLEALDAYAGNQKARNLLAVVERRLGHWAEEILEKALQLDPLDYWALNEAGKDMFGMMSSDPSQTILDLVFEYTGAGLFAEATDLLKRFIGKVNSVSPMVLYTFGWTLERLNRNEEAANVYAKAAAENPDYCFPSRLEEMRVLQQVVNTRPDARAAYYLGNLLYGKEHYEEAIVQWEKALRGGEKYYVLYRNLGMASYNNRRNNADAIKYMQQAMAINPDEPQLIFEFNLLLQLANVPVAERIRMLEGHMLLVERRDDLYLELVRAYNEQGNCEKAIRLLESHTFTPCEGGEHAILEQYIFIYFKLGRKALSEGKYEEALNYFRNGQTFPKNLGAGVWNIAMKIPCMYYEAKTLDQLDEKKALDIYRFIADMGIDLFSYMYQPSMDYYRAMTFERLGEKNKAKTLLENAMAEWTKKRAEKDYGYFQLTPFFLSFLQRPVDARQVHYDYLLGLGWLGLGDRQKAKECFTCVLETNSGHLMAALEKSFIR